MNMRRLKAALWLGLIFAIVCLLAAYAHGARAFEVLKISPRDERAVIRTANGMTRLVKPGDTLTAEMFVIQGARFKADITEKISAAGAQQRQGTRAHMITIVEIADGRVVLEELADDDIETVIIRLINGKQTVERVGKKASGNKARYQSAIGMQLPGRAVTE